MFEPRQSPEDFYWLAGLLEGEGSFLKPPPSSPNSPAIKIEMIDQDVIERVAFIFQVKVYTPRVRKSHWRQTYRACLTGIRAVDLMTFLYPLMSQRRQQQINMALEASLKLKRRLSNIDRITIVERLRQGEQAVLLAQEYKVTREHVYRLARARRA